MWQGARGEEELVWLYGGYTVVTRWLHARGGQELGFVLHRGERLQAVDVSAAAAAVEKQTPDHWVRGARGEELGIRQHDLGDRSASQVRHLRSLADPSKSG